MAAADLSLYRKAAEQGDVGAQIKLGISYEKGQGVSQVRRPPTRPPFARPPFTRTRAARSTVVAHVHVTQGGRLGCSFPQGALRMLQDMGQAISWYEKAAQQGNSGIFLSKIRSTDFPWAEVVPLCR